MTEKREWTEDHVESLLGRLLQLGVLIAAALVTLGGIVYLARAGTQLPQLRAFHGEPEALRDMSSIVRGAIQFDGPTVIQLGLLVLIATPIARVAFSLLAFWYQRDRMYVAITCVVLALLLLSISGAI
jgi:uncharacterized membrane protein